MNRLALLTLLAPLGLPIGAVKAQEFRYDPPGQLVEGSGRGRPDDRVYVPGMRFPIEAAPAFANSQVWGHGGLNGPGGGQCDAENYSYPWRDNYCESRQWDMPLCPAGTGHQGQDIRPSTCENRRHRAVAAEDGVITSIGGYSVGLMSDSGTLHRYLHMDPPSVAVREGQRVRRGDFMGLVSNAFNDTPTTIHLHYDLQQNVNGQGTVFVPTYLSLIRSYEELLGRPAEPCAVVPAEGGIVDDQGPCFHPFGPAATWRTANGGEGGSLRWTYAWVSANPGNWARWDLHLAAAGRYRVAVRVVPEFASSQAVRYRVRHGGREADYMVSYAGAPAWLELGELPFVAGGDQWIEVYDNTGEDRNLERRIIADAVRLEAVAPVVAPDQGVEPPPRDQGVVEPVDQGVDPREDARVAPELDEGVPGEDARRPAPDRGVVPGADARVPADGGATDDSQIVRAPRARFDDGCRGTPGGGTAGLVGLLLAFVVRRRR